jgi:hypothetical protein
LWISIFFSILFVGSQAREKEKIGPYSCPESSGFLERAGQALVAGRYQKARPYSVEAVILYGLCKYFFKEDTEEDSCMIIGIGARLAIRMGYHRDPGRLSRISPFEGEMRRRTFFTLEVFDILFSMQAGLPPVLQEEDCDTAIPSNLFDSDFDEDCTVL